jgi:hypothetical protein
MSLSINVNAVCSVLLRDGWHDAVDDSFLIDAYEYVSGTESYSTFQMHLGGGQDKSVSTTGFGMIEEVDGRRVTLSGPISSIVAVREKTAEGD